MDKKILSQQSSTRGLVPAKNKEQVFVRDAYGNRVPLYPGRASPSAISLAERGRRAARRTHHVYVRLDDECMAMLEALKDLHGASGAAAVSRCIREAHKRAFPPMAVADDWD